MAISAYGMHYLLLNSAPPIMPRSSEIGLCTIFILINAPGALQLRSPENDILMTEYGQIYQNFNILKP